MRSSPALALALSVPPSPLRRPATGPSAKSTAQVTITRDRNGVAHIVAKNFTALGLGEGYAFAQDNLCTFADDIVTLRGERSKYFGATPWPSTTRPVSGHQPAVRPLLALCAASGDRRARTGRDRASTGCCRRSARSTPASWPAITAICARASCTTRRARASHGSRRSRSPTWSCAASRSSPRAPPSSSSPTSSSLRHPPPPVSDAAQARGRPPAATTGQSFAALRAQFGDQADRAQGSNGIGSAHWTPARGHGIVLANPHFPWRGTERFWMAQLDVPGQYDVEGGTLEGFPLVGIGFNRHIAWTHTVSTTRRFVLYQLKLVPGHPTSYYVDGKPVPMGPRPCRSATAATRRQPHLLHDALGPGHQRHRGPGAAPTAGARRPPTRSMTPWPAPVPAAADQYLRMGQATSVQRPVQRRGALPGHPDVQHDRRRRPRQRVLRRRRRCARGQPGRDQPLPAHTGIPTLVFPQARIVTLDGSHDIVCARQSIPAPRRPACSTPPTLPHTFRRDYVENSNDSYWLANPNHPLPASRRSSASRGTVQGLRTRIGNQMIAARIKGTDHLGAAKFTIATLQRMWEGDRSELAALVLRDLVADCRAHPTQTASNGQTRRPHRRLRGAGRAGTAPATSRPAAAGCSRCGTSSIPTVSFYTTAFDPGQPLTTPSGAEHGPRPATPLKWLADAVLNLRATGLAPDASYAQVQHAPQSRGSRSPAATPGALTRSTPRPARRAGHARGRRALRAGLRRLLARHDHAC